ncbi:hypothetical protein CJF31_00000771 [Rutstroemia sp. NJR-2017a BVV2]|nr:hypothetical protein CJF31_00000771 [Rutstroemia sp. NJR-2017a BVV2]
MRRKCMRR